MNFRMFTPLCLFITVLLLCSCSDDEGKKEDDNGNPNQPTAEYYIQFKANGVLKTFQTNEPGYQSCGNCACSYLPVLAANQANIQLCNDDNDWITAVDIQGFDTEEFSFTAGFPIASFHYTENNITYLSDEAVAQIGSIKVTNVEADGNFGGKLAFKVIGTFSCSVRSSGSASDIAITEGKFVVRYAED